MQPEPTVRFNFDLPLKLRKDLDKIALKSGRSGAADILRQLAAEYVCWYVGGRTKRRKPAWLKEQRKSVRAS